MEQGVRAEVQDMQHDQGALQTAMSTSVSRKTDVRNNKKGAGARVQCTNDTNRIPGTYLTVSSHCHAGPLLSEVRVRHPPRNDGEVIAVADDSIGIGIGKARWRAGAVGRGKRCSRALAVMGHTAVCSRSRSPRVCFREHG